MDVQRILCVLTAIGLPVSGKRPRSTDMVNLLVATIALPGNIQDTASGS
jgi:hypothetical protein